MTIHVETGNGRQSLTLDTPLGSGDTADVFSVTESSWNAVFVAKLYRRTVPDNLSLICQASRDRELTKLGGKGADAIGNYSPIAGPKALIFPSSRGGTAVGLLIVRVDPKRFVPYEAFIRTPLVRDLKVATHAALCLAEVVAWVHDIPRLYVVGDFSGTNVRVDANGHVCLLDVDSFGILNRDHTYLVEPEHSTMHYIAPESHGSLPTQESDRFILAMLVLELLLGGISPFAGVKPAHKDHGVQDHINEARSWLLYRDDFVLPPKVAEHPGLLSLPPIFTELAQRAITVNPQSRPEANDWLRALQQACVSDLVACRCGATKFRGMICSACRVGFVGSTDQSTQPAAEEPLTSKPTVAERQLPAPAPSLASWLRAPVSIPAGLGGLWRRVVVAIIIAILIIAAITAGAILWLSN